MANQQGKRSQNDPNAPQNQGNQQSIQSSDEAQHMGSTDQSRSVQSGVSGIPSQMHAGADRAQHIEKKIDMAVGNQDQNTSEGGSQNQSQAGNFGTASMRKGSNHPTADNDE